MQENEQSEKKDGAKEDDSECPENVCTSRKNSPAKGEDCKKQLKKN